MAPRDEHTQSARTLVLLLLLPFAVAWIATATPCDPLPKRNADFSIPKHFCACGLLQRGGTRRFRTHSQTTTSQGTVGLRHVVRKNADAHNCVVELARLGRRFVPTGSFTARGIGHPVTIFPDCQTSRVFIIYPGNLVVNTIVFDPASNNRGSGAVIQVGYAFTPHFCLTRVYSYNDHDDCQLKVLVAGKDIDSTINMDRSQKHLQGQEGNCRSRRTIDSFIRTADNVTHMLSSLNPPAKRTLNMTKNRFNLVTTLTSRAQCTLLK